SLLVVAAMVPMMGQVFPGERWTYNKDNVSENWDVEGLKEFHQYIIDSTHVTGLVIIHKGEIVHQYGDVVENSYIASCRKSVLAMLYGKYVEDGTIDLDKTIGDLKIDDVDGILPQE